jgi:hypothetical protein
VSTDTVAKLRSPEQGQDLSSTIFREDAQRLVDLDRASETCRHRFDHAFMTILVERLTLANTRLMAV